MSLEKRKKTKRTAMHLVQASKISTALLAPIIADISE